MKSDIDMTFQEAVRGFLAGDFSRLAPLFETPSTHLPPPVIQWYESGLFASEPKALEEAFTCASFNGCTHVIEYLLTRGVNPNGGANTGLSAFHWAANRGQLKAVEMLIRNRASLETQNAYGGTVLGCAVWSAIHEPSRTTFGLSRLCSMPGHKSVRLIIHRAMNMSMKFSDSMTGGHDEARPNNGILISSRGPAEGQRPGLTVADR